MDDYIKYLIGLLMVYVFNYFYENVDPALKPRDVPINEILSEYDFIIVGAGSTGSIVANKISENGVWTVLLVEAGGDENGLSDAPLFARILEQTIMDWNYTTIKQKNTCGISDGICHYPRGRVLGGTSTIYYMMHARGHSEDFNEWANLGNPDWSYNDVLPIFISLENTSTIPNLASSGYRGTDGPVPVEYPRYQSRFRDEYIRAGKEFGLTHSDYNGEIQNSVIDYVQFNIKGSTRASSAKVFLNPIRQRRNLHVSKNSLVTNLVIDPNTKIVSGICFRRDGHEHYVQATKEIILSAGAINSPQLLMLSGIGPREHLNNLSVPTLIDLPVGQNLQDHILVPFRITVNTTSLLHITPKSMYEYATNKTGPLTALGMEVTAFLSTSFARNSLPDIQFIMGEFPETSRTDSNSTDLTFIVVLLKPKSRGTVMLRSLDPSDPPLIDPNYLFEDMDYQTLREGCKLMIRYISSPSIAKLNSTWETQWFQSCGSYINLEDEFVDCVIRQHGNTIFHPIGTVKMGPKSDKGAVVDPQLIVHGVPNLRVIDASIMPTMVRANVNAACQMIGIKGADYILSKYSK